MIINSTLCANKCDGRWHWHVWQNSSGSSKLSRSYTPFTHTQVISISRTVISFFNPKTSIFSNSFTHIRWIKSLVRLMCIAAIGRQASGPIVAPPRSAKTAKQGKNSKGAARSVRHQWVSRCGWAYWCSPQKKHPKTIPNPSKNHPKVVFVWSESFV